MDIPIELADEVYANPENASEVGIKWAKMQCQDLVKSGVRNLHFYVMNDANNIEKVVKDL